MRLLTMALCLAGAATAADVPAAIPACVAKAGAAYKMSHKVMPEYFAGDFDGDGKTDYAVVVERGDVQGIAVCWARGAAPVILGAGAAFHEMKNLDFPNWKLHPKKEPVGRGFGAGRPPVLSGDAFYLEWEAGSAIVYWRVNRFVWYQQGD